MNVKYIGISAALINASCFIPVLYKVIIEKSTHSISYYYVVLGFISQILWFLYSYVNKLLPLLLMSTYLIFFYSIIAFYKWHYEKTRQDVHSKLEDKCVVSN